MQGLHKGPATGPLGDIRSKETFDGYIGQDMAQFYMQDLPGALIHVCACGGVIAFSGSTPAVTRSDRRIPGLFWA